MYARALAKNREDAEDLVSDTILACYEKFDYLKDLAGFKGYVFKTIRSLHRQKHRRSWLFGFFDESKSDDIVSLEPAPDMPYDIGILYKALENLSAMQKEAVVLFEISGFSIKEIMKIQGGTESGVKSRIKRGKEKLRSLMLVHHSDKNFIFSGERREEVEK